MKRPLYLIAALAACALVVSAVDREEVSTPGATSSTASVSPPRPSSFVRVPTPALDHADDEPPADIVLPARLASASLVALRDDAASDVRRCTDAALGRQPDAHGRLAVAYRIRVTRGRLHVLAATATGPVDDALASCIAEAGQHIELDATNDEDGVHSATLFFDVPSVWVQ